MHFRERGSGVQLVRTVADPGTNRPKQEVIGRMRRHPLKAPDEVVAKLTEEERIELDSYIERVKNLDDLRRKLTAHTVLQTVTEAADYLRAAEDEGEQEFLREQFAQAILLLRRASIPRPPRVTEEDEAEE